MNETARVVTRFGAELILRTEEGQLLRAVSRRNAVKQGPMYLRPPVCGDYVRYQTIDDKAIVVAVEPRRNVLVRPDHRGQPNVGVANVDQVLIVVAPVPSPDWGMIDRYLTAVAALQSEPLLILNKSDMSEEMPHGGLYAATEALYAGLGYPVLLTSTVDSRGIKALRGRLRGHTNLLVGQSGVGKSSLVHTLDPGLEVRIGDLSALQREGRHTTTAAHLYSLCSGGDLIDSPGVRDFAPYQPTPEDLAAGFPEIADQAHRCRFHDCRHRAEPGCAVKHAVREGLIPPSRLRSFLELGGTQARDAPL